MTFTKLTHLNEILHLIQTECKKWRFDNELTFEVETYENSVNVKFSDDVDTILIGTEVYDLVDMKSSNELSFELN